LILVKLLKLLLSLRRLFISCEAGFNNFLDLCKVKECFLCPYLPYNPKSPKISGISTCDFLQLSKYILNIVRWVRLFSITCRAFNLTYFYKSKYNYYDVIKSLPFTTIIFLRFDKAYSYYSAWIFALVVFMMLYLQF